MLSILRLIMIPLFIAVYFKYPDGKGVYYDAGIYVLAWATDALDGWLARRNGWITEAGKILDPLADKAMQFSAVLCFTIESKMFLIVLIPLVIKELGMLIGSMIIIKKSSTVAPSRWYGKVATCVLFLCALIRILIRGNTALDIVLSIIMLATMLFALIMYYFKAFKGKYFR